MTNVSYAVGPSNPSQEYFSNISSALGAERQAKTNHERGGVISPTGRGNTAPLLYPVCVGHSHVFRKRPQGVAQALSAAKRGGAERLCDGCPCVGAEEICGVPSPVYPCRNEGKRHLPNQPSGALPTRLKKVKRFNLRSRPRFCYRGKVVPPACANSSPDPVPPHPRFVEPQAPLHAHHTERKN